MKEYIKSNWKFYAILLLVILIINMLSGYTLKISNKLYTKGEMQESTSVLENIEEGTEISQTFIAVDNNLEKISIEFEPYKNNGNCGGRVLITIKDNQENIIAQEEILRNHIRENTNYTVEFKRQENSKDQEYTINIKFEDLQELDKFYTVKYTNQNGFTKNKLFINGEEIQSASLIFQDFYKSNIRTNIYNGIILLMNILALIVSIIIYTKKSIKIENIFLMIAPIVCIFFLTTMPTFKNHDEYYHWLKAYEVSMGNLMTPIENGIQGSNMPGGVSEIFPSDWTNMTYKEVKEKLEIELDESNSGILNPETAAVYSFVQYIPQAIGIYIARHITSNAFLVTYGGRLVNLLTSILLIYFAIKIIPFGKKLLLVPAMIPIAIEGFSSLSPDALTISMSFLYIAYIMYLAFGKKQVIGIKEKVILLIMSIIIALCKIVYIPLVGLILIIPKEKFKNKTNKSKIINFIVIAGISVVINLAWLAISSRYLATFREGDSKIQVLLALQHPIQYIQSLIYTINIYGDKYLLSLFGAELGWGEFIKLHSLVPYILLGVYTFISIIDEDLKNKFKTYQIIWIVLVCLAIIGLVFTSLYVQWTTIGSTSILGVQGRYFLPILPLIMVLVGALTQVKSLYKKENINKFVGISLLLLNIFTIAQIIIVHL